MLKFTRKQQKTSFWFIFIYHKNQEYCFFFSHMLKKFRVVKKKMKKQENHIMGTLILTPRSKFIWKYLYISHFFDNWKIEPLQMTDQIFFVFYITKIFCKV